MPEVEDLFRHANDVGINANVIAAVLVARLIDGGLSERLSRDAQVSLALFQERAREATDMLREIGRQSLALDQLTQDAAVRALLRQPSGGDRLERLARIQELLDHLEDVLRRSSARRILEDAKGQGA